MLRLRDRLVSPGKQRAMLMASQRVNSQSGGSTSRSCLSLHKRETRFSVHCSLHVSARLCPAPCITRFAWLAGMEAGDPATGRPRGYLLLRALGQPDSVLFALDLTGTSAPVKQSEEEQDKTVQDRT